MSQDNRIPQLVQDLAATATNRATPRFQRDIAAQTLERIQQAVNLALASYYQDTNKKRG